MYCMESMDVALSSDFLFLFLKSTTIVTFCSPGHAYFKAATIALGWKEHWEKSCSFFVFIIKLLIQSVRTITVLRVYCTI